MNILSQAGNPVHCPKPAREVLADGHRPRPTGINPRLGVFRFLQTSGATGEVFYFLQSTVSTTLSHMSKADIRWVQRFQNFKRAFHQLSAAVELAQERDLSELEQQGLIQAFEFTHELAWNTLKDFLEARGTAKLFGSKDATRAAFTAGLIENGEVWMEMVESRNKSTHTYEGGTAEAIAKAIASSYQAEFEKFQTKFMELEREEA
jgi:nucleotidyltransferase substrate binding protein (TIGR01987 family)